MKKPISKPAERECPSCRGISRGKTADAPGREDLSGAVHGMPWEGQDRHSPLAVAAGQDGYRSTPSFGQMKLPPLLALDAGHRAIGESFFGSAVQCYPD
jgi:hypothetical protein